MIAKIYRPARTAMQSGMRRTKDWVMEFEHDGSRFIEPLMGWTGSKDMAQELMLYFSSVEEAVEYAKKRGIAYEVWKPEERVVVPKSYASNFM